MKQHNFNRSKLSQVMTYSEFNLLDALHHKDFTGKHPTNPYPPRFEHRYKLVKTKANLVTRVINDFLNWMPQCKANRINTMGIPSVKQEGRIKSISWRPSGMEPGISDIIGSIKGRMVNIEVKNKDKQSEYQKKYQKKCEDAGEIYLLVHSFTEFYNHFKTLYK